MRVRCIRTCTVGVSYFEAEHVYEWPEGRELPRHFEKVPQGTPMAETDKAVVPDAEGPQTPIAPGSARPEYTGPLTMNEAAKDQSEKMQTVDADHSGQGVV